jgi:hypothetical protein
MSAQHAPTNLQLEKDQKEALARFTLAQSHTNFKAVTLHPTQKLKRCKTRPSLSPNLKVVLL